MPIIKLLPAVTEPVVDKFSSPNEIAPEVSVILPSANVRFPILDPVAACIIEENIPEPFVSIFPSNLVVDSVIVNVSASVFTIVAPFPNFKLLPVIVKSLILRSFAFIPPVFV